MFFSAYFQSYAFIVVKLIRTIYQNHNIITTKPVSGNRKPYRETTAESFTKIKSNISQKIATSNCTILRTNEPNI